MLNLLQQNDITWQHLICLSVQQIKNKILERVDSVTSGTDGVSGDDDVPTALRQR